MKKQQKKLLFMSGTLPARSETFVYREIFALRSLGAQIETASVHSSEKGLGTQGLEQMANATIQIYARGKTALIADAMHEFLGAPCITAKTVLLFINDAVFRHQSSIIGKLKIIWQGIAGLALARRIRKKKIAHVHAHMAHVPTTIAMYAAKQCHISFSFTGHANDLFPNRSLLKEKIQRALFVNCISHWHRRFYREFFPKSNDQLPIVRCGLDTKSITVAPEHKKNNKIKLLGVGRLVKKKGFDVLIKAADKIAKETAVDLELTIAGSGPEENALKQLVSTSQDPTNIKLAGEITNESALKMMAECDIFVLPCKITQSGDRDGIPVVLMEAMSRARCVIAGDLVTLRELIADNETGILLPKTEVQILADKLIRLIENPQLIQRIGLNARKVIEKEYDSTVNAIRFHKAMRLNGLSC